MTRAQRIAAILDRLDYHKQTPQRLIEAIAKVDQK